MSWDSEYMNYQHIWGEQPSELAVAAVRYVLERGPSANPLSVLDIGCGYGRDAFYLLGNLPCSVVGIDLSPNAIDIASRAAQERQQEGVEFRCCNLTELADYSYDIVFMSNLYQVLKTDDRERLRDAVKGTLRPEGLAFLSTLSVNDPEHSGKGVPVPKDPNSFFDKRFVHLSTRRELVDHFDFLAIKELYEHEYYEPRANGEVHHHISWILIGERPGETSDVEFE